MAMTTTDKTPDCVLLADRHHGLTEGVRGLLGTLFKTVVMVADESSLQESAARLRPEVVVADLSLARDRSLHWLTRLRRCHPEMKLVVLSVHDEPSVRRAAMDAGADGFVLSHRRDGVRFLLRGRAPPRPGRRAKTSEHQEAI